MSAKQITRLCGAKVVNYFGLSKKNCFLESFLWGIVYSVRCRGKREAAV